jgi:UDP-N-acetylmuramyl tripeptide synthase
VRGRDAVDLAKNPAGLNQVLRGLTEDSDRKNIALFLNDRLADGRDISWIWDADFERLAGHVGTLTVSGVRAWDMALRVKYAGIADSPRVIESTAGALAEAIERTPEGETLYVIPTKTAMLEARNILAGGRTRRVLGEPMAAAGTSIRSS